MNMLENTSHVVAEVFKSLDDVWNMVQLYFSCLATHWHFFLYFPFRKHKLWIMWLSTQR